MAKFHELILYPAKPHEDVKKSRVAFEQFLVEVMTTIFTAPVIPAVGNKSPRKEQRDSCHTHSRGGSALWLRSIAHEAHGGIQGDGKHASV